MRLSQMKPLGVERADVGNWQKRLDFTSDLASVEEGQHREYSYQNTVELALIAAFVAAGLKPSKAVAFSRTFVISARLPGVYMGPLKKWLVIPVGDHTKAIGTDTPDPEALSRTLDCLPVFNIVGVAEIIKRVDALFAEAEER